VAWVTSRGVEMKCPGQGFWRNDLGVPDEPHPPKNPMMNSITGIPSVPMHDSAAGPGK
jgi:hypothetical protein